MPNRVCGVSCERGRGLIGKLSNLEQSPGAQARHLTRQPTELAAERPDSAGERQAGGDQGVDQPVLHPMAAEALQRMGPRAKLQSWAEPPILQSIQAMLDGMSDKMALLDCSGTIVAANPNWQKHMEARGGVRLGLNFASFLTEMVRVGYQPAEPLLRCLELVLSGEREHSNHLFIGIHHYPGAYKFHFEFSRIHIDKVAHVLVTMRDAEELVRLKRQRRLLQDRLLHAEEHERRHIARELHDSTGQLITGLQLGLMRLESAEDAATSQLILGELGQTIGQVQRELRALSFICHPPALIERGLVDALRELVSGFGKRTGLNEKFSAGVVGPCSASIEAAIYRVAQEALSNVHRHAHATGMSVQLLATARCIHLVIGDDGIGFDSRWHNRRSRIGVGIAGMAERLRALGGRLAIRSNDAGTVLIASLPRHERELGM